MRAQLSFKTALPLAERIATASDHCSKTGPGLTPLDFVNTAQRTIPSQDHDTVMSPKLRFYCTTNQSPFHSLHQSSQFAFYCVLITFVHVYIRLIKQGAKDKCGMNRQKYDPYLVVIGLTH